MAKATLGFPVNRETPIRAELNLTQGNASIVTAVFILRHSGVPCWDVEVHTTSGVLRLTDGGSRIEIEGNPIALPLSTEYPNLYRQFGNLIRDGQSDVDVSPMQLVADAFLCARRLEVEAFLKDLLTRHLFI
jgi:hypothetical protein